MKNPMESTKYAIMGVRNEVPPAVLLTLRGLTPEVSPMPIKITPLPPLSAMDIEHFWTKVRKTDGCWEWLPSSGPSGRAKFCYGRGKFIAARVSWTIAYGEIPEGMYVCHHCDNPSCTRPDHLFLGTSADNSRDMVAKGRKFHQLGEYNPNARLTYADFQQIHRYLADGLTRAEIARRMGVSWHTVGDAACRDDWPRKEAS